MAASYKQPNKRVPQKPKKSTKAILHRVWKNSGSKLSLKRWAREQLAAKADDLTVIQAQDWFFNKRADFHSNQLCSGRTRTRVKKGGSVKGPEKNLSGK